MHFKNIVLIGMPGSGKTTLGKIISQRTGMPFIDTDLLIEQTLGKPIYKIFAEQGEKVFRDTEKKIIKKVAGTKCAIIAIGGGAWMYAENRALLKKAGQVVYISCRPEELWRRLKNSGTVRPLLSKGFESLMGLYHNRHRQYLIADFVFETVKESALDSALRFLSQTNIPINNRRTTIPPRTLTLSFGDNRHSEIMIGNGIMDGLNAVIKEVFITEGDAPRLLIVTNPVVHALCGERVHKELSGGGFDTETLIIPDGEMYKTLKQAEKAYSALALGGYDRGDVLIALGGGVIGDLTGFVAATYMRGMKLIQIPTTLLSQVDSSVGGKTAVNLAEGKNLVGTFYQPGIILSDIALLKHLSEYQFRQGLAECMKYGLIEGGGLLHLLEKNTKAILDRESSMLVNLVEQCCRLKAHIVREDEKEGDIRRVLNFGHTIGHALEAAAGYGRIGHGDAVALGIRAIIQIGHKLGDITVKDYRRVTDILNIYGFPQKGDFPLDRVLEYAKRDKKKSHDRIRFILAKGIGNMVITADIPEALIRESLSSIGCK